MELLLNLVWLVVSLAGFYAFLQKRAQNKSSAPVTFIKAVLALGCVVVLLFPIVSASDDLHPTQAVLEDASKHIQLNSFQLAQAHSSAPMFPVLLLCVVLTLMVAHLRYEPACLARVIDRERIPGDGRSPPSLHP